MQLLLLGGYSPHNQAWIHDVGDVMAPLFERCVVHDYEHWQSGKSMDFESELSKVADKAPSLSDYAIFAKSIGIMLAAEGSNKGLLKPKLCVFAGLPFSSLDTAQKEKLAKQLKTFNCPLLFVQNAADPLGSYADVKIYLESSGLPDYSLLELPGDTHSYDDLGKLKDLMSQATTTHAPHQSNSSKAGLRLALLASCTIFSSGTPAAYV